MLLVRWTTWIQPSKSKVNVDSATKPPVLAAAAWATSLAPDLRYRLIRCSRRAAVF